jgi:hypothetical protein
MFSLQQALMDGVILSLVLSVLVIGSLYYNPRLWLQDYPKAIQEKVPPLTREEKRLRGFLLVPMLLIIIGIPLISTYGIKAANSGSIQFATAYAHAFVVTNLFNVFDAVVLDLLLLTFMRPKFATLPGAEGMEYLYRDWGMQLRNFLKGVVFCSVFSGIVAIIVVVL